MDVLKDLKYISILAKELCRFWQDQANKAKYPILFNQKLNRTNESASSSYKYIQ
jgi:hypothetical protein